MIPDWLQKIMTDGITIPVKFVITPELDTAFLKLLKSMSEYETVDNIICPDCGSDNIEKRGFRRNKKEVLQKYKCKDCGDLFTEPKNLETQNNKEMAIEAVNRLEESMENKSWNNLNGVPSIVYRESGDYLNIMYCGYIVKITWPEIIRLSTLERESLESEINKKFPNSEKKCYAVIAFIHAYRDERVRDPDAGIRHVLNVNTRTDYDGNKIEGTMEG